MSKVVLVTGGSSGIGKAICEYLDTKDFRVYGTSRKPENYENSKVPLLTLEVTDENSIKSCVEELISREGRIDVLVNNAGVGITGPVEEIPMDEIRKHFETNVFGPLSLSQKVLPQMRVQNSGLIINITSIAAYMGLPFRGVYSGGKAALHALSEAIRLEVKGFNIRVTTIAPGDFATNIASGRYHAPVIPGSAYEMTYGHTLKDINSDVNHGNDPTELAQKVYSIIQKQNPKVHYRIGAFMQKFSVILKRILPGKWFEKMLANHHKL